MIQPRDSNAAFARVERIAKIGSWRLDLSTGRLRGSAEMYRVFGVDPAVVGADLRAATDAAVHPDDRPAIAAANEALLTGGISHPMEYRITTPDGAVRWVYTEGEQERDPDGNVVALVGFVQDITERKHSEDELRLSQRFAESVLSATPDMVYIYDLGEGRNVYVNREVSHFLGYSDEQVEAFGPELFANILHPDDAAAVAAHHARMAVAGEGEVLEVEFRMRHFRGEWRWLYSRDVGFERNEAGEFSRVLGMTQDVTDRKLAEEALAALNEELEQRVLERTAQLEHASRAKSDFLSNMSHELRTPLNSILGFSGVLLQGLAGPLGEEQRAQVTMINNSGRHLLDLMKGVLELARIERGETDLVYSECDACGLAEEALETVRPMAADKGLLLDSTCELTAGPIVADRRRVEQILLNLLSNAVKFTEKGEVSLSVRRVGDEVVFAVSDTGRGIPSDERDRVFEDFFQGTPEGVAKTDGTGLGLSLCRRLSEMMGGRIEFTSEPGVGSEFRLYLPA